MILAGDIGGTHARLAFFDIVDGNLGRHRLPIFPAANIGVLTKLLSSSWAARACELTPHVFASLGRAQRPRRSVELTFGSSNERVLRPNFTCHVLCSSTISRPMPGHFRFGSGRRGYVESGEQPASGNQAVIAAGTGLGEAGMSWDGQRYQIFACEGGHSDFAPRNEIEIELLRHLAGKFGHVSYERIVSGPGLVNVFHFLRDTGRGTEPQWLTDEMLHGDPAAAISKAALEAKCPTCEHALDIFVSLYAAEAGNLALKLMATGGIYLGGGIAPKLLPKLAGPLFMQNFANKGRMQPLLESIPVYVIVNDQAALMGAARCAMAKSTP